MISNTEVIVQDQLLPSVAAGKVRVHYPRGSTLVLSIGDDGAVHTKPDTTDGAWEQASVLPNGNLLFLSDQPTSLGTLVLGANLKPLG